MINDQIIINTFFENNKYNYGRTRKTWLNKHIDIYNYLCSRYNDSESLNETIHRIKNNIEIRPTCLYCGGHVKYNKKKQKLFNDYCSSSCGNLDPKISKKRVQNSINKYGEGNYNNRKKCKQTCLERYGIENWGKSTEAKEKIKNTCLEKYGVDNVFKNKEIINKIRIKKEETCIKKYGVKNVAQVKEIQEKICKHRKENNLLKYGVEHIKQLDWVKLKEIETKRKNGTFNTSIPEKKSYELLKEIFPDVLYQYKSDVYPFSCDFYIPSLDLYIECNYHWTHGKKPFEDNENDKLIIENWKAKNTQYYMNAINTWTKLDVKKRTMAKENKLNYLEFWNIEELKEWLKNNNIK